MYWLLAATAPQLAALALLLALIPALWLIRAITAIARAVRRRPTGRRP